MEIKKYEFPPLEKIQKIASLEGAKIRKEVERKTFEAIDFDLRQLDLNYKRGK